MKKSLFAMAAATAFAGAAQAQSSVTVYGLLDVGYVGSSTRIANGVTVNKTTGNAFSASGESTSRLGFKGIEDLGGGTSASFTVELGLTPNGQQAVGTSGTQNRQTFVGLKKNGLGEAAIGTQYTIVHKAVAATDPGQANNILGNLIYPAVTEGAGSTENSTGAAYTVRTNNQLSLSSANFAGFTVNGMLAANNKNSNQTTPVNAGVVNNQNGWGLGANYVWKNLFVTANYQALSSKNPYSETAWTSTGALTAANGFPAAGYAGGSSAPGPNVIDNQMYFAATYDFSILKAYAQYIKRKVAAEQDSSYYAKRTAQQIGVRSFITPTVEAWASGALGRYTGFDANAANMTAWQLGSNYWLSKRTNLYAIYGQVGTSNSSIPKSTTLNPVSANGSNYAVGVRHTF